jgi:hypothetical protein
MTGGYAGASTATRAYRRGMTENPITSAPLSGSDVVEGLLVFTTGPVLAGTLCPGLTLCVPGLVLLAAPIVALAALGALLAAIAAVPCLLVSGSVRLLRRPRAGGAP